MGIRKGFHSTADLLTGAPKKSLHQVQHDGERHPDFEAGPGKGTLVAHHVSHGDDALVAGADLHPNNIARSGRSKHVYEVAPHSGMTEAQHFSAGGGGLGYPTTTQIPGINPMNPDTMTGKSKRLSPVRVTPGMRNRTSPGFGDEMAQSLSEAILSQAQKTR